MKKNGYQKNDQKKISPMDDRVIDNLSKKTKKEEENNDEEDRHHHYPTRKKIKYRMDK